MLNIDIIYHNPNMPKLEKIDKGDWIDLRASVGGSFEAGDFALVDLGVSMHLPDGYEAHIAPRSSTFKNWGIIQANRICQFRIVEKMEPLSFTEVTELNNTDRGGFGSTGNN